MKAQIIITPCVCKDGTHSAIVALSTSPMPYVVTLHELGSFVTSLMEDRQETSPKTEA